MCSGRKTPLNQITEHVLKIVVQPCRKHNAYRIRGSVFSCTHACKKGLEEYSSKPFSYIFDYQQTARFTYRPVRIQRL